MPADKSDPLGQSRPAPRALWLGKENMAEARDNFWRAYQDAGLNDSLTRGEGADRRMWDIAFAAAVAAFSYIMEGRTQP